MGKRILQDNGSWLRTLKKPNVELVRTAIERIVPDGVVTVDGTHHDADVICYATGFRHNDFLASMDVTGRNGVSLRDQWGDEPTAHLGITIPELPEPLLHVRPGHEPRGTVRACSSTPSARSTTRWTASTATSRRVPA